MTYDEFWNGDPLLARYYHKANDIRREQENEKLWLQGLYFLNAIGSCLPGGNQYPDAPYPITESAEEKRKKVEAEKNKEALRNFFNELKMRSDARNKRLENDSRQS